MYREKKHSSKTSNGFAWRATARFAAACCALLVGTNAAAAPSVALPSIFQAPNPMAPGGMSGSSLYGDLPFMMERRTVFEPTWTLGVGARWLTRSNPASGGNILASDAAHVPRMAVDQFAASWQAGPEVFLICDLHNGWDIGYTFFCIDDWDDSTQATFPGELSVPLFSAGGPFDHAAARFASRLYSHQLNARVGGPSSWIRPTLGLRFLELHDEARLEAASVSAAGSVECNTNNYLYGPQSGVEFNLRPGGLGWFEWGGFMQFGLLGAWMQASTSPSGDTSPRLVSEKKSHLSFLGEAGLSARFRFNDHLVATAGYEVLYLAGVAEAWGVYTSADAGRQMKRGCPVYHGGRLALELRW